LGSGPDARGKHRRLVSGSVSFAFARHPAYIRLVLEVSFLLGYYLLYLARAYSKPWITPSMFEDKPPWVVDEYTYGAYMSSQPDKMGEIRYHWNTWFQYYELENIASIGLNTIRIQVGFWSLIPLINGESFLVGAFEYLKLGVTWAQSLNLKVSLTESLIVIL